MSKILLHQKLPFEWNERENLRNKGQFWTPKWVANAMVEYVSENTDLIFDPATGRGAFYKALLELNKTDIAFLGADIDDDVLNDEIYNRTNCIIEKRDFIKNPPQRKFNAIVANPPYIRHHRIDNETKNVLKQLSIKILGFSIDGRAGYHIYFLIQALNLLKKNGKLAFIMPADTCEGKFSKKLWEWISERYCIESVITFNENATPFPNVDTNAIVFLIKNSQPQENIFWIRVKKPYSDDLLNFVKSKFIKINRETFDISIRKLVEAISTGLTRPEQCNNAFIYHLHDFANIMRGIATGSNEFFFLTAKKVKELGIPEVFIKRAIGRTRDITKSILTMEDIDLLEKHERPTYLLSLSGNEIIPNKIKDYLKVGEEMGLPDLSLIRQRKPWYKMERREPPPLLFTYLGRRNIRFIKNQARVLPLTGFLCVYPIYFNENYVDNLWQALNHPDTLENLLLVGKSYGSGAIKVEPSNLKKLPIPDHIVEKFKLDKSYISDTGQLKLFREPKKNIKYNC
jgi:hypothetical protein